MPERPLTGFAHAHAEILERRDRIVRIRFGAERGVGVGTHLGGYRPATQCANVSVQEPDIEDVIRTVYGRDVGG